MALIRGWLDAATLDIRFALRSWRKAPGGISIAVVMLAAAIGLAGYFPSRRAAAVDAASALRFN